MGAATEDQPLIPKCLNESNSTIIELMPGSHLNTGAAWAKISRLAIVARHEVRGARNLVNAERGVRNGEWKGMEQRAKETEVRDQTTNDG
jgi:hypothetical protein